MDDDLYVRYNLKDFTCYYCKSTVSKLNKSNKHLLRLVPNYEREGICELTLNSLCQCIGKKHKMLLCIHCGIRRKVRPSSFKFSQKHLHHINNDEDHVVLDNEMNIEKDQVDECAKETNNYDCDGSMNEINDFHFEEGTADVFESDVDPVMRFLEGVDSSELPETSVNYFKRQCSEGKSGKALSVAFALLKRGDETSNAHNSADTMSVQEMDYHYLLAKIHRDSTVSTSQNICTAMNVLLETKHEIEANKLRIWKESYISSIEQTLQHKLNLDNHFIKDIIDAAHISSRNIFANRYTHEAKGFYNNMNPSRNDIKTHYTQGQYSLTMFVPKPPVVLKPHSLEKANIDPSKRNRRSKKKKRTATETIDEVHAPPILKMYASISVTHAINHLLAIGTPAKYCRVGYDSDWYEDPSKKRYISRYLEKTHRRVQVMNAENTSLDKNTRAVFARIWSDGFSAKDKSPNTENNNIQVFTVTLVQDITRRYDLGTLPLALTYKKKSHKDIQIAILEELAQLARPVDRLWLVDGELKVIPTIVFLESFFADLPERCSNTSLSLASRGQNMHNQFGVSSHFDKNSTPSCRICDSRRIQLVLGQDFSQSIEPCNECSDWHREVIEPTVYPLSPDETTGRHNVAVRLSFELLVNSIQKLCVWIKSCNKRPSKKKLQLILSIYVS